MRLSEGVLSDFLIFLLVVAIFTLVSALFPLVGGENIGFWMGCPIWRLMHMQSICRAEVLN